jgi:hypothetical protein
MRTLDIFRRAFAKRKVFGSRRRVPTFVCGDCERWERCGLPPHDDCIVRAAQIERGWTPLKRCRLLPPC